MELIAPPPSEIPKLALLLDELTVTSAESASAVIGSLGGVIPAPAWIKDTSGVYRYANHAFHKVFAENPVGKKDADLWLKPSAIVAYGEGDRQARFGPVLRIEPSPHAGTAGVVDWLVCKFPIFREGIVDAIAGFALPIGKTEETRKLREVIEETMKTTSTGTAGG